jgi:hypothetical protein
MSSTLCVHHQDLKKRINKSDQLLSHFVPFSSYYYHQGTPSNFYWEAVDLYKVIKKILIDEP